LTFFIFVTQEPSVKVLQQRVRITLKNIECLSYNFDKPNQLQEVLKLTKQLEATVKDMAPNESGLVVRPSLTTTITARKIKLKYKQHKIWKASQKYSKLPKPRKIGRPKSTRQRTKVKYAVDVSKYSILPLDRFLWFIGIWLWYSHASY